MDTSRYRIREATKDDIPGIVDVFFHSFTAPVWRYLFPDTAYMRQWWTDAWTLSLDNPTDRSFVVEDVRRGGGAPVAFSRWVMPQRDGNLERRWPAMAPEQFDMVIVEALLGGMDANRARLMGSRPHWFLEFLATHENHQRQGLGGALIRWGTAQADADGLETYLDASEKGLPFYTAGHGFEYGADVRVPDRPSFGHVVEVSLVRPPRGNG